MPNTQPKPDVPDRSILEQHFGTVMQVLVIGLLGWSLKTTQELSSDVSVLKVQIANISANVATATSDRYRGVDADRDHARIYAEMRALEARVTHLDDRGRRAANP